MCVGMLPSNSKLRAYLDIMGYKGLSTEDVQHFRNNYERFARDKKLCRDFSQDDNFSCSSYEDIRPKVRNVIFKSRNASSNAAIPEKPSMYVKSTKDKTTSAGSSLSSVRRFSGISHACSDPALSANGSCYSPIKSASHRDKSFICRCKRVTCSCNPQLHPHTKHLRKFDCLVMHNYYRNQWSKYKFPPFSNC